MQLPVPAGTPEDAPVNTSALGRLSAARDRGFAVAEDLWQRSAPTRAWLAQSADGLVTRARARAESLDTGAMLAAVPGLSRWSKARADASATEVSASSEGTSADDRPSEDSATAPADTGDRNWRARLAALPELATPVMAQGRQAVDKVTSLIARRAELATLPKPSRLRTGIRSLQEYVQNKAMKESAAMGSQAAEWVNRLDSKGRFAVITRRLTPAGNTVDVPAAASTDPAAGPADAPGSAAPKPRTRKPRSAASVPAADGAAAAPAKRTRKTVAKDANASAAPKPARSASRAKAKAIGTDEATSGEAGAPAAAPRARTRAPAKAKVIAVAEASSTAAADAPQAVAEGSPDQPTA